ncbi:MAG TPA: hypothetical protein V6C89_07980 [Drouetiella sp.]|jgi:hypothetical protein
MARPEAAPTREEKKGTERVESAISKSPSDPSPFLKELGSITGPSQARTMAQLDKDGYGTRAEGLEAQKIMSDLHSVKSAMGYGQITKEDIQKYGDQSTNPAEKALAKRLQEHFTQISTDGKVISQGDITKYLGQEQNKADMRNLHAKDATGKTLLDSVGDGKGGVSGDKLDKKLADPNLTDADRASLNRLNEQRDKWGGFGSRVGDLTADQVKKMDENAGLKPEEISKLKKQAVPQSADQQATEAALKDLVAKPGGGQSLLDKIGNGQGGVDESKVSEFMAHPERHNLTPENQKTLKALNDQITNNQYSVPQIGEGQPPRMDLTKGDLQKMGADAGVNFDRIAANPGRPNEAVDQRQREQSFSHLFDKQPGKPSLYDQVKNPDGGISGDKLDEKIKHTDNPADLAALTQFKKLQQDGMLYGKKDISKEDLIAQAHQHNMSDAALKKAGIDTTPRPAEVPAANAAGEMKPEGHKALVVHSGQGYYHVAERLLSEAHKGDRRYEPSQKELKELVAQLQNANGHRKSLSSKEELKIDDAIKHNPALAGLFA